jgi:hypothetical protein
MVKSKISNENALWCQGHEHTRDFDCELRSVVRPRWDVLNLLQREHAVDHFSKHVFPVQEITGCRRDEELQSFFSKTV